MLKDFSCVRKILCVMYVGFLSILLLVSLR